MNSVDGTAGVPPPTPSVVNTVTNYADSTDVDFGEGAWILCAASGLADSNWVMLDSGASVHVCPKGWMQDSCCRRWQEENPKLRMASGAGIPYHGHVELELRICGVATKLKATFIECDVARPILSVAELGSNGHNITFNASGCEFLLRGQVAVPTSRRGRLHGVDMIRVPKWVAPVTDGPAPMLIGVPREGAELQEMPRQRALDDAHDALGPQRPELPSAEEIANHNLTHLPAKAWCRACAEAGSRDADHVRQPSKVDSVLPLIEFDFFHVTGKGDVSSQVGLVGACRATQALYGTIVPTRVVRDSAYTIYSVVAWIQELGHTKMVLQTDGEPALHSLIGAVAAELFTIDGPSQVSVRQSPAGSHQSNGTAERTVQTLRKMARIYIRHLELNVPGLIVGVDSPWWGWAVRHASWVYNRFHKRSDSPTTAYEKYRWRRYGQPILELGECVMARRPAAALASKGAAPALLALWLGRYALTDDTLLSRVRGFSGP